MLRRHHRKLQLAVAVAVAAGCFATVEAPEEEDVGAGVSSCLYTPDCADFVPAPDAGIGNRQDTQACPGPDRCVELTDPSGWDYSPDMVRPGNPGRLEVRFEVESEIPHGEEAVAAIEAGWERDEYYAMAWLVLLDAREESLLARESEIDPVLGKYMGGYIDTLHIWSEANQRPGPFALYRTCTRCEPFQEEVDVKTTPTPRLSDNPPPYTTTWDGMWGSQTAPDGVYALWI